MNKFKSILFFTLIIFHFNAFAESSENILNLYTWSGVIPDFAIREFEKQTGVKVNFSTYDSNEVMYAKLKADADNQYDIVEPSSYYIDRMRKQGMLQKLNKSKLPNFKNLNPSFLNQSYDKNSQYSLPFIWGVTGIFINKDYIKKNIPTRWSDFWDAKYVNQLLLLDDSREVFSMALHVLGYSGNDSNPAHIREAYLKLKAILPNVKIFNSAMLSIMIDEDVTVGMNWNGAVYKARIENPQLEFIYPQDGFSIWVDTFAIPKNAPHLDNAYKFLNFMMEAKMAKRVAIDNTFATANLAAQKLLPASLQNDPIIYPSKQTLKRGEFQNDIGDNALMLYEMYWEQLKMGG